MVVEAKFNIEREKFDKSRKILEHFGLDFSQAIKIFIENLVKNNALPFEYELNKEIKNRINDIENKKNIETINLSDITKNLYV